MKPKNIVIFDVSSQGLEPTKDRVLGITVKTADEEFILADRDEHKLLATFWEYLKEKKDFVLVGFNSDEFDIPMLLVRSMKHKVPVITLEGRTIDLRKAVFNGRERKKGTLRDFQAMLGVEFPQSRYAKHNMTLLWEAPDLDDLVQYLLEDVKITWALYEHAKTAGIV